MKRLLVAFHFITAGVNAQEPTLREIVPGIYGYWIEAYRNKAVIIEFDRFLAVAEFPHGDSISETIIASAIVKFPKKPIRYVFHTHHHDHSSMGFDAFLRRTNALLVTGRFNYEQIKAKTRDTLALQKRVVLVDSLYELKSGKQSLQLFVLHERNYEIPTKEFNLVYLPAQKLLVSGCLFNKPLSYHEVINSRKTSLQKFLRNSGKQVDFFIPTNTTRSAEFEDVCTREMFDQTFEKGINPSDFATRLQRVNIEHLERKADSLVEEFRKIPRGYDYGVCAQYLQNKQEYTRAIIVYKSLIQIYPSNAYFYYRVGECYEAKNAPLEAAAFYRIFVKLSSNKEDKLEAEKRIQKLENFH